MSHAYKRNDSPTRKRTVLIRLATSTLLAANPWEANAQDKEEWYPPLLHEVKQVLLWIQQRNGTTTNHNSR